MSDMNKLKKKEYDRLRYQENKELKKAFSRKYYAENRDACLKVNKEWAYRNRDKMNGYNRERTKNNPEAKKKSRDKWFEKNPNYKLEYDRRKKKEDLGYRLRKQLRSRLGQAIRYNQKSGSAVKDLGCSIDELKQHLESLFQPGMSWENWSYNGWHIDHIIPLASFNLRDREQLLKACHYTNLQPLWGIDNLKKRDK